MNLNTASKLIQVRKHTHIHTNTKRKLHFISILFLEGANMKNEFMQMSNNPTERKKDKKDCVQNKI